MPLVTLEVLAVVVLPLNGRRAEVLAVQVLPEQREPVVKAWLELLVVLVVLVEQVRLAVQV
jgi:hypothetical protein